MQLVHFSLIYGKKNLALPFENEAVCLKVPFLPGCAPQRRLSGSIGRHDECCVTSPFSEVGGLNCANGTQTIDT